MFKKLVDAVQIVAVVAAAVTVLFLFAGGDTGEPADESAGGDVGADVYSGRCASCHGSDGGGGVGPALAGGAVVEAYPEIDDEIAVITEGRGAMPSFGDDLTPEEIEAVAVYTREDL